jgi:hypothetical protein
MVLGYWQQILYFPRKERPRKDEKVADFFKKFLRLFIVTSVN